MTTLFVCQAEDGIRYLVRSRGLGDVYKRQSTMFRDAFMTSLVDGVDIDKQDYRPAILFINGEYLSLIHI